MKKMTPLTFQKDVFIDEELDPHNLSLNGFYKENFACHIQVDDNRVEMTTAEYLQTEHVEQVLNKMRDIEKELNNK